MKVLMLGWEFPPFFAGGAGIVCSELSKALIRKGTDVTFVMPSGPEEIFEKVLSSEKDAARLKLVVANNKYKDVKIKIKKVSSLLHAYSSSQSYDKAYQEYENILRSKNMGVKELYGKNLKEEVYRFAQQVLLVAEEEEFDVIHAHDWVTFPAAVALKEKTGKPLVVHVHITEFDKTGSHHADPFIYSVEKNGMDAADVVITVSEKIRDRCVNQYYVNPNKIRVVHNAAPPMNGDLNFEGKTIKAGEKVVLFAGRVTLQKGPDYFVYAAKKVLKHEPNTKFVIAGTGDMLPQIIQKVAELGMAHKFLFTGFFTREQAEKLYSLADVFVMPSVSEPFGLVPYEAQLKQTPTIISKQSGISEVLHHTLKVDFWNVDDLASKIISLLRYSSLSKQLMENGYQEARGATWDDRAAKCLNIYSEIKSSTGKGST